MGTVLCKLFSYLYTISLSHSSGVVNTVFRFVSFRHLASSELSLHFTEKTSPITLTVFLIKLLGNYTQTDRHTATVKKGRSIYPH